MPIYIHRGKYGQYGTLTSYRQIGLELVFLAIVGMALFQSSNVPRDGLSISVKVAMLAPLAHAIDPVSFSITCQDSFAPRARHIKKHLVWRKYVYHDQYCLYLYCVVN